MKWLNKLFSKEEEIPSTVAFDEIDVWLDLVSQSLFRDLNTNAAPLYKEIRKICERLEQNTAELQDAEPKEDIPEAITRIGLSNRDKLVKNLYSLTEKIAIPTQTDYKTVLSFYDVTASSIKFVLDKSSKTIYHIRSLFPNEVKEVITNLNRLKVLLNQLITPIKRKESQIMKLEEVPEIVRDIKNLKSDIEKEKENVRGQEEECSTLETRIRTEEERLEKIEEEPEWMRFKELETNLSSLQEELNALESDVNKLFSPLNKSLNLLKKQHETGRYTLTHEEIEAISLILSSPVQALYEDINGFLHTIKNIIEGEPSVLKDRKRDKTLNWIDHLLNTDLSAIKEKRELLQSRIEENNAKLSGMTIHKDKREIEQSIVSAKGQLTRSHDRIDRSKRRIVSLEEEHTDKGRVLLETLETITGKEIDVKF